MEHCLVKEHNQGSDNEQQQTSPPVPALPNQRYPIKHSDRTAVAPYNFVPLPNKVVTVDPSTLAEPFGAFDSKLRTGVIECTLITESPLYVRGGLSIEQVQQNLQSKDVPEFFALDRAADQGNLPRPVIPGSSLRGMLRSLIEIAAYAKVSRVTDRQHYFPDSKRAATPRDFVPERLRNDADIDIAEAIFGFVRDERQRERQVQAGRIQVSDAIAETYRWFADQPITPKILASPKPTTFQHYLVQTDDRKVNLRHYGSRPGQETVIRGQKVYWHKGNPARSDIEDGEFLQLPSNEQDNDTQHTKIRPVAAGSRFRFQIRFTNLSDVELGALLWVLQLCDDSRHDGKQYRLKLGMGKPLGLGSVKLEPTLSLAKPKQRYQRLFAADGKGWEFGEETAAEIAKVAQDCVAEFNDHILTKSGEPRPASGQLKDTLRIQMLLALLSWPGPQPVEEFSRYMEIERRSTPRIGNDPNEYKDRPVLPDPRQVLAQSLGQPLPEAIKPLLEPTRRQETPSHHSSSHGSGSRQPQASPKPPQPIKTPPKTSGHELIQRVNDLPEARVANEINRFYNEWRNLAADNPARVPVAEAIIAKIRSANREKKSAGKAWYQELLACVDGTEGKESQ